MTREEAIVALKARCSYCVHFPTCVHDKPECFHAAEMAIKSLEAWDGVIEEIRKWYFNADVQYISGDPCVVDAMIDLFIRTIKENLKEVEE